MILKKEFKVKFEKCLAIKRIFECLLKIYKTILVKISIKINDLYKSAVQYSYMQLTYCLMVWEHFYLKQ